MKFIIGFAIIMYTIYKFIYANLYLLLLLGIFIEASKLYNGNKEQTQLTFYTYQFQLHLPIHTLPIIIQTYFTSTLPTYSNLLNLYSTISLIFLPPYTAPQHTSATYHHTLYHSTPQPPTTIHCTTTKHYTTAHLSRLPPYTALPPLFVSICNSIKTPILVRRSVHNSG